MMVRATSLRPEKTIGACSISQMSKSDNNYIHQNSFLFINQNEMGIDPISFLIYTERILPPTKTGWEDVLHLFRNFQKQKYDLPDRR